MTLKLSILIPVLNEIKTLPVLLKSIRALPLANIEKEIIIVDDGSTDGTTEFLKSLPSHPALRIVFHPLTQGKGAAIQSAIPYVHGDIIVIQDADLEYSPDDYALLIEPIVRGKASAVYGSRILNKSNPRGPLPFYLGGKLVTALTNLLFNTHLTDEPTGYKVFKSALLKSVATEQNDFCWDIEITAKILRRKEKIHEVPISYQPRSKKEGKKINFRDGIKTLLKLVYYRFARFKTFK